MEEQNANVSKNAAFSENLDRVNIPPQRVIIENKELSVKAVEPFPIAGNVTLPPYEYKVFSSNNHYEGLRLEPHEYPNDYNSIGMEAAILRHMLNQGWEIHFEGVPPFKLPGSPPTTTHLLILRRPRRV